MKLVGIAGLVVILIGACAAPPGAPTGSPAGAVSPSPQKPGPLADTWTRDGTTWHQQTGAGPSPRYLSAIAYDAARHVYVLFGGWSVTGASDETWTSDGTTWTLQHPAHRPGARRGAAMAFDVVRKVVVLYGGLVADSAEGHADEDTWTWDGVDWTPVLLHGKPGFREGARMASAPDGVILYGGRTDNTHYFDDAWKFDGSSWSAFAEDGPSSPPARASAAIAWDAKDQALFVFGGIAADVTAGPGAQGVPLRDAWLLTRQGWASVQNGPTRTTFSGAIWNASNDRIEVIFGMVCPNPVNDSWSWDRTSGWSDVAASPVPARWGAALAADTSGNVLVFGGDDESGC